MKSAQSLQPVEPEKLEYFPLLQSLQCPEYPDHLPGGHFSQYDPAGSDPAGHGVQKVQPSP